MIQALIVDDEPLARLRLRQLLQETGNVKVVDCANGEEALRAIEQHKPDVLFVDVQMPGMSGFSILERLGPDCMPLIVFVTAYDHYALKAFENSALDYLLKPFDSERFALTMQRVRAQLARQSPARRPLFFVVGQSDGKRIVAARDIDWIGAAGNYVELHVGAEVLLHRESIRAIEARMRGNMLRVHRSAMVNVDKVDRLQWSSHGDGTVILKSGRSVPISRRYSSAIREVFSPAYVSKPPA